jgi:hypothetical protein
VPDEVVDRGLSRSLPDNALGIANVLDARQARSVRRPDTEEVILPSGRHLDGSRLESWLQFARMRSGPWMHPGYSTCAKARDGLHRTYFGRPHNSPPGPLAERVLSPD